MSQTAVRQSGGAESVTQPALTAARVAAAPLDEVLRVARQLGPGALRCRRCGAAGSLRPQRPSHASGQCDCGVGPPAT